jgi:hypothetical protein
MMCVLVLMALLALPAPTVPVPTSAAPAVPQDVGVYKEDFTTYAYRDNTTTAAWDTLQGILHIPLKDGIGQSDPAVACDDAGNTVVVWRTRDAIHAHKYNPSGNPLWTETVQVNVSGLVTSGPAVALDSSGNAVIVWHDERNGDWDVYAQKLGPDGSRLWASDKLISVGNNTAPYYPVETAPAIAVDDGRFFVAWHDYRGGWDIYAQRLDSDGNRLWPSDVRVNRDHPGSNRWPHAAAFSGRFTIVWTECDSNYLYAQQLDSSGTHQWANDTLVSDQHSSSFTNRVTVGADGTSTVAWSVRETYVQRLSTNGTRTWTIDLQVAGVETRGLALASLIGGSTVIAWREGDGLIYAQRIAADAAWEWPEPLAISDEDTAVFWYSVGMATDPVGRVSIAWVDDRTQDQDIYLQRFTQDRQRLWQADRRANSPNGAAEQTSSSIAAGTGYRVLAWVDFRGGGDVYVQKVNDGGTRLWNNDVRANVTPGLVDGSGTAVALAADGSSFVVWVDKRNEGKDIYAQRIDENGNRLWVSDAQVNATYGSWMLYPRVVVAPSGDIVVTWWGNGYLCAQKLNKVGERLWDSDVVIHHSNGSDWDMDVDSAGNCLVTWWEYRHGGWPEPPDIFAQKIDPDSNLLWGTGGVEVDLNSGGWHLYPAVAVDSSNTVWIAWDDFYSTDGDIFLQRLSSDGEHLWSSDQLINSDGTGSRQTGPEIGIDGDGNAVVAWADYRNDPGDYRKTDIYAQRMSPIGSLLWGADVLVNEASGDPRPPSLAVSGDNTSVAWVDLRDGDPNIYTQRLTSAGTRGWGADLNVVQPDHFYFPTGTAQSRTVDTVTGNIHSATLTADYQTNGGEVRFYLTNDGGAHWVTAPAGAATVFTTTGSDLRWRAVLSVDPVWNRTPVVNSLRIEYSTQVPYADDYEMPDDTCAQAQPIQVNGAAQAHTFHQQGDADWVWFNVTSGSTYIVQTSNTQANADTKLELRPSCPQPPLASDDNAFGRDARITWQATFSGPVYVQVSNHDPSVYGPDTGYDLSVRTFTQPPVAVIVAGHDDGYTLQPNIDHAADMAYRTFVNSGVPKANVRYFGPHPNRDVDGNGLHDDIYATVTITGVREAVQDWSREQGVQLGVPFYVYLVDHGHYDQFLADGTAHKIWATDLNLWLSNLEATSGADNVTVILEACHSGSFIDVTDLGPAEVSGRNRVVIASTSSALNAYPSAQGAYFSDVLWTALGQNQDLKAAFETATQGVQATGLSQQPWLDDNGDAVADGRDGALARSRGLGAPFAGSPPAIDWVRVGPVSDGQATIRAQVRDDFGVAGVWVEVYPPDFVEPEPTQDGTTPVLDVPTAALALAGTDLYSGAHDGFTRTGEYRLVVYARDGDGNLALPRSVGMCVGCVYLPLVLQGN